MTFQRRLVVTCAGWLMISIGWCWTARAFEEQPAKDLPAADEGGTSPAYQSRSATLRQQQLDAAGGTSESEQAVAAAINWLARHQNPDGSWGCAKFTSQCKDPSCTKHPKGGFGGGGGADYPAAATAFGLLPFLASGQTHQTKGPYQKVIENGLTWLTQNQNEESGRFGSGSMYEHGLATIAICEAYGLSKDPKLEEHCSRCHSLHRGCTERCVGRLALHRESANCWRHFGVRLAVHEPQECSDGGPQSRPAVAHQCQEILGQRLQGQRRRFVFLHAGIGANASDVLSRPALFSALRNETH